MDQSLIYKCNDSEWVEMSPPESWGGSAAAGHSSQEVRNKGLIRNGPRGLISQSVEGLERVLELFVDVEEGGDVATSVAVVWRGPDGHEVLVLEPELVAVHDELVGTGDQIDVVDVIEFGSDLGSKEPSSTSRRHGPGLDVFGVGPHEIAEGALVRDLHASVDQPDLVDGLDLGRQSSVDTEHFALDNGSDSKVIKDFSAVFPGVGIAVLSDCLIVEPVDRRDLPRLVVASQQRDVCWVLHLEAEEQLEGLDRVEAAIDEVTHEDVPGIWNLTAFIEKFQ